MTSSLMSHSDVMRTESYMKPTIKPKINVLQPKMETTNLLMPIFALFHTLEVTRGLIMMNHYSIMTHPIDDSYLVHFSSVLLQSYCLDIKCQSSETLSYIVRHLATSCDMLQTVSYIARHRVTLSIESDRI
jgi:hypothetical protein